MRLLQASSLSITYGYKSVLNALQNTWGFNLIKGVVSLTQLINNTSRLTEFITEIQNRFISSLCVEEFFHVVKNKVSKSSNTRCTPQRAWSHIIDEGVMSVHPNHFEEVDRHAAPIKRNATLSNTTFVAPLREKKLEKPMQELKLSDIQGFGPAKWWSPGANTMFKPHAEVLAARLCDAEINLKGLKYAWLSQLCCARLLIRQKGNLEWMLSLGHLSGVVVKTWPIEYKDTVYQVELTPDTKSDHVVILDENKWEAIPVKPISPMHMAARQELTALGKPCTGGVVKLQDPSHYTKLTVGLMALSTSKPLPEVSLRQGFPTCTLAYMIELCVHRGLKGYASNTFSVLTVLAYDIIKKPTVEDLAAIYVMRGVAMEPDDDCEALMQYEYVLEIFDETERKVMEESIKSNKNKKSDYIAYKQDYKKWKALYQSNTFRCQ